MAEKIITTEYSEEMQRSYLNYSMSVITARAIPDVRDGLKPVQRRVLYDMDRLRLDYDKPHRKSARIVGDTMGKYHPHGDSSIYDTLVVMSQDFKKGMPLVDGHGNFGSIEGDGAAAMRYTEARLQKFTQDVYLKDLDKTVRFVPNYDETEQEPEVLPVRVPNLLINGSEGIAVGMSTSIPTHNLGEVIDTALAFIDNQLLTAGELLEYLHGPDFPTGGIVANRSELEEIYATGQGKLRLRAKMVLEEGKRKTDKDRLVITEIPYTMIGAGINKCLQDIGDLAEQRLLPEVTDISNQSNKEGIRIVLEVKKGADIGKIRNLLYKKTKLEDTFGVNMLAISGGRPETMNLPAILRSWLDFQYENNTRKYQILLEKEEENKEVKEGLIRAVDCIDLIIAVLRGAKSLKEAKACLTAGDTKGITFKDPTLEKEARGFHFTERQADAILQMRLYRLIGLELIALQKEYLESLQKIRKYSRILKNRSSMDDVIREDLLAIKKEFAVPRRTVLEDASEAVYVEEAPAERDVVFTLDRFGYAKVMDPAVYDKNREMVDSENVWVIPCTTAGKIAVITDAGLLHQVKVSEIPSGKPKDKGTPIDNLSRMDGMKERPVYVAEASVLCGKKLLFATKTAMVKVVPGEEFVTNNRMVAATKLADDDKLISVQPVEGMDEIVLQTKGGMFLRFALEEISEMKKASRGVRGMKLGKDDEVTGVWLLARDAERVITCREKEVHLNRLKLAKRDGKGTKVKL
ncbi:MAG: DNA topoisomerase 4 subunit A [Clostridium sp.]|nr:DNA topoisomerase 4 subunit A [Clostridium sp.]